MEVYFTISKISNGRESFQTGIAFFMCLRQVLLFTKFRIFNHMLDMIESRDCKRKVKCRRELEQNVLEY